MLGEQATRREQYFAAIDQLFACREITETGFQHLCTMHLAEVYWCREELTQTTAFLLELAERRGREGDLHQQALIWNNLGIVHADLDDTEQAEASFHRVCAGRETLTVAAPGQAVRVRR